MIHYVLLVKSLVSGSCFQISMAPKPWHYSVQMIRLVRKESPRRWWPTKSAGIPTEKTHKTSDCSSSLVSCGFSSRFESLFNDEILGLWHRISWGISAPCWSSAIGSGSLWSTSLSPDKSLRNCAQPCTTMELSWTAPHTQKEWINKNPISFS